jgi:hypothetical protein
MEEIRNKVKESGLINLDLADFKPNSAQIIGLDIADQLWQGLILKEKDFREHLKQHDWTKYQDHFVAVFCSTDAILPAWASVLVTIHLAPFAKKIVALKFSKICSIYKVL